MDPRLFELKTSTDEMPRSPWRQPIRKPKEADSSDVSSRKHSLLIQRSRSGSRQRNREAVTRAECLANRRKPDEDRFSKLEIRRAIAERDEKFVTARAMLAYTVVV